MRSPNSPKHGLFKSRDIHTKVDQTLIVVHGTAVEHIGESYRRFRKCIFAQHLNYTEHHCAFSLSPVIIPLQAKIKIRCKYSRHRNAIFGTLDRLITTHMESHHEQQRAIVCKTLPQRTSSRTCSCFHLLGKRIKLQDRLNLFDQYVMLKNTVTQMVYKHAISTVVLSAPGKSPARTGGRIIGSCTKACRQGKPTLLFRNSMNERPAAGERAVIVQLDFRSA